MNRFWRFAFMMLRYKRLLGLALAAALLDAACKAGGFGAITWVVTQFIDEGATLHGILGEKVEAAREHFGYDLSGVLDYVPEGAWTGLAATLGVIFVLMLIGSIGRFLHEYLVITVSLRTVMRIRKAVFTRLVHLPLSVAGSEKTAEQVSRVVRDAQVLAKGFNALTSKAVSGVLGGAALLVVALVIDWRLTLLFLVVVPPMGVLIRRFGKRIRKASRRALRQYGHMLGAITEALHALRVVKVHQTEGYERRRFNTINRRVLAQQLRARTVRALSAPVIETLSMVMLMTVVLIASWSVLNEGREAASAVGALIALAGAAGSFRQLTGLNNSLQEAAAAAQNIDAALRLPVEGTAREEARRPLRRLPRHRQSVAFEGVTFTYPGARSPALRGVELRIPYGTVCAVVGANGSGKSTLVGLVPRLYEPQRGRVRIDGVDIAECTLRSVRRQVAMVTQETVLFDGTVAENITYGARHVSRRRMVEAAQRAHAERFIEAMPDGYQTQIGERGQRLSGGQRQRLAIARAILRDPAILILDEATSQIDADSEHQIAEALGEFMAQRTTFVIAHRLSTVVGADMIVVLERGAVASIGTHRDLMDCSDVYRVLCQTQLQELPR